MHRTVEEKSQLSVGMTLRRRSAVVRMTGVLYGLTLAAAATVFAVSSAMQDVHTADQGRTRPPYLEVFQVYLYGVSLFALCYLNAFAFCQRRQLEVDEGTCRADQATASRSEEKTDDDGAQESTVKIASATATTTMITTTTTTTTMADAQSSPSSLKATHVTEFDDDVIVPGMTFDGDGVNLYLRIGLLVFGIGSMVQNGFQLAQLYQDGSLTFVCFSLFDLVVTCLQMAFTFFQAFSVFKLHKIVVRRQRGFFRWAYVHLLVANLSMWLFAMVQEVVKSLRPLEPNTDLAAGNETETAECSFMRGLSVKATPFLYPCTVQYALVGAMIVYKMYRQMNAPLSHHHHHHHHNQGTASSSSTSSDVGTDGSTVAPAIGCDKTRGGLFLGILVVVTTVVAVCCFFVFLNRGGDGSGGSSGGNNSKLYATFVYFSCEYLLLALACLATFISMLAMRKLTFVSSTSGRMFKVEKVLLVFSYAGVVLLKGFYIVALATELSLFFKDESKHGTGLDFDGLENTDRNLVPNPKLLIEILSACSGAGVLLHALFQTKFIVDALNLEVVTLRQRARKPGRSTVTFLLLCNLSLLLTAVFEEERVETKFFYLVFFENVAWRIISCVTVPLLVLFRFLSCVCLLTVWKSAYFPRFGYRYDRD